MKDNLGIRVGRVLDQEFNNGMRVFNQKPEEMLRLLFSVLEIIDECKNQVNGVLEQAELFDELFPMNPILRIYSNPLELDETLVGEHADSFIRREELELLGFEKMKRKKKSRIYKKGEQQYMFNGKIYSFNKIVYLKDVYAVFDEFGIANDLKSYGLDIDKQYKSMFIYPNADFFEVSDAPEFFGFYNDFLKAYTFLEYLLGFLIRIDSTKFGGFEDPTSYLEGVYNKYKLILGELQYLKKLGNDYLNIFDEYTHIGKYRWFGNLDGNQDIYRITEFAKTWREGDTDFLTLYEFFEGKSLEEANIVEQYIDYMESDRVLVESLSQDVQLESEVLKDNYLYYLSSLQEKIIGLTNDLSGRLRQEVMEDVFSDFVLPTQDDFDYVELVEFEKSDIEQLVALKEKYLSWFAEEVDLDELFLFVEQLNLKDENLNFYSLARNFGSFNNLNSFKLSLFMDVIFRMTLGVGHYVIVNEFLNDKYQEYLNRPPSLDECESLDDLFALWDDCEISVKYEIKSKLKSLVDTMNILKLSSFERAKVRYILSFEEAEEGVFLSDFFLDGGSSVVLNLRQIEAFMNFLGAKKEVGSSSHVKYKVALSEGHSYSYTISTSVIQSGKYFAVKLLQDIAIVGGEPRCFNGEFVDKFVAAFGRIGMRLLQKNQ